jgi:hypothetical protein
MWSTAFLATPLTESFNFLKKNFEDPDPQFVVKAKRPLLANIFFFNSIKTPEGSTTLVPSSVTCASAHAPEDLAIHLPPTLRLLTISL